MNSLPLDVPNWSPSAAPERSRSASALPTVGWRVRRVVLGLVLLALIGPGGGTEVGAGAAPFVFPRSRPEAQGVASARMLEFVDALDAIEGLHSVMVVRHGTVIAEGWWAPYRAEDKHELYSLSKSFTSTAVGFAVSEGRLSLDDEVLKFFAADAPPEPGPNLKAMRV